MNYSDIRRLLLKVFLGFLSVTALVAIFSVLSREFGETQIKVLATTFSISAGSICAMSCAAFLERKGPKGVGFAGIAAAVMAVLMVIIGVWAELAETDYWKTTVVFIVVSVAFAHACLLRLPNLSPRHRWTQTVSNLLVGLLALQVIFAVWGEIKDEGYYRFMAALSVLVVLMTLVVPICSRLRGNADLVPPDSARSAEEFAEAPDKLILQKVSGTVFSDPTGRRYQVTAIKAEPDAAPNAGPAVTPPASEG